ncbi:hypothetical protein BB560_001004 [Smittium megazygosporum]|uniref:Uncharacterized protein n=1 Tax=Smittium megazygosporum TaxID=133381 RepID=A0A2T9ZIU8_9FUNG|nr:hypothetical protein BB560_001004 [Smittium megazygosporum]
MKRDGFNLGLETNKDKNEREKGALEIRKGADDNDLEERSKDNLKVLGKQRLEIHDSISPLSHLATPEKQEDIEVYSVPLNTTRIASLSTKKVRWLNSPEKIVRKQFQKRKFDKIDRIKDKPKEPYTSFVEAADKISRSLLTARELSNFPDGLEGKPLHIYF